MSKQLQVLARPGNNDKLLEDFMWIMGVAQDHGIIPGAMKSNVMSYYTKRIYLAVQRSTALLDTAINKLRGCPPNTIYFRCFFNESSCPNTRHFNFHIVVYNPLAWPVTMPIRIPILKKKYDVFNPKGIKIRSVIIPTPSQVLNLRNFNKNKPSNYELVFIAIHLPPLGYRSYYILESATRRKRIIDKLHKTPRRIFRENISNETTKRNRSLISSKKIQTRFTNQSSRYRKTFVARSQKHSTNENSKDNTEDSSNGHKFTARLKRSWLKKLKKTTQSYHRPISKNNTLFDRKKRSLILMENSHHPENSKSNMTSFDAFKKSSQIKKPNQEKQRIHKNYLKEIWKDNTTVAQRNRGLINIFKKQQCICKVEPKKIRKKRYLTEKRKISKDNTTIFDTRNKSIENKLTLRDTSFYAQVKRSLIKKLNKNPQKYFIRQTSRDNVTVFEGNHDYEYIEEGDMGPKIDFGNISKDDDNLDYNNIVTPKHKVASETPTPTTNIVILPTEVEDIPDDGDATEVLQQDTTTETKITVEDKVVEYDEGDTYYFMDSDDMFIKNKYIQINLDEYRKLSNITLSNGIKSTLDIQFYYYVSDEPLKMGTEKRSPGAYIFRPMDNKPEAIIDYVRTKVYKTGIVQEIHCEYSKYASFALKLYTDSPIVEIDWLLGPVPIDDGLGKEVFLRYATDMENGGVFYTDANARQTMKRIRNKRALYEPYNLDPVAGNFYPVTSRIYIEDLNKNMRLSIFNDRSQGGTSLLDGTIDMMLNRRIRTYDIGSDIQLNDTDNEIGIIRGTHYLYLTKADFKQNRVFEKKFSKENELKPQIMVSSVKQMVTKERWLRFNNEFSALKTKLPIGVHLLTLQEWNDHTLLIRLENYLEKIDVVKNGVKRVFLKDLFYNIKIKEAKETMLAANIMIEDFVPLQWIKKEKFVKNFNNFYGGVGSEFITEEDLKPFENIVLDDGIVLTPQQIRTFVLWYDYK